jgi:hypothetical protein
MMETLGIVSITGLVLVVIMIIHFGKPTRSSLDQDGLHEEERASKRTESKRRSACFRSIWAWIRNILA